MKGRINSWRASATSTIVKDSTAKKSHPPPATGATSTDAPLFRLLLAFSSSSSLSSSFSSSPKRLAAVSPDVASHYHRKQNDVASEGKTSLSKDRWSTSKMELFKFLRRYKELSANQVEPQIMADNDKDSSQESPRRKVCFDVDPVVHVMDEDEVESRRTMWYTPQEWCLMRMEYQDDIRNFQRKTEKKVAPWKNFVMSSIHADEEQPNDSDNNSEDDMDSTDLGSTSSEYYRDEDSAEEFTQWEPTTLDQFHRYEDDDDDFHCNTFGSSDQNEESNEAVNENDDTEQTDEDGNHFTFRGLEHHEHPRRNLLRRSLVRYAVLSEQAEQQMRQRYIRRQEEASQHRRQRRRRVLLLRRKRQDAAKITPAGNDTDHLALADVAQVWSRRNVQLAWELAQSDEETVRRDFLEQWQLATVAGQ